MKAVTAASASFLEMSALTAIASTNSVLFIINSSLGIWVNYFAVEPFGADNVDIIKFFDIKNKRI
jgi:hypothetical protein